MISDEKIWFVKVGQRHIPFDTLDRYIRHSFQEHEDDIMGWDLLRGCLHDIVVKTSDVGREGWEREDDEALNAMMDKLLSCPVCHEVPRYNAHWYCTKCQRQMTLKDVAYALNELKKETGVEHCLRWDSEK
jgi:hypothetical protein